MHNQDTIKTNRERATLALKKGILEQPPSEYSPLDYDLDTLCRKAYRLPERPRDNLPYGWLPSPSVITQNLSNNLSNKVLVTKVIPKGVEIPEQQLRAPDYPIIKSPVLGLITVTGGFMEAHGHSAKREATCIWETGEKEILPPSDRNLGIDYVSSDGLIRSWYPGLVLSVGEEKGYGLRCHIRYDTPFFWEGQRHAVTAAFAHAKSFGVKEGYKVDQGEIIGFMGNSGGNYPLHVDYRLTAQINGVLTDISPNLYDRAY